MCLPIFGACVQKWKDGANIGCIIKREKPIGKKVLLIDALIAYVQVVVARVTIVVSACAWFKAIKSA